MEWISDGRPSRDLEQGGVPLTRRQIIVKWLCSGWIKALPELWFAWFLIKGRNVQWTKSLMGMSYVSSRLWLRPIVIYSDEDIQLGLARSRIRHLHLSAGQRLTNP